MDYSAETLAMVPLVEEPSSGVCCGKRLLPHFSHGVDIDTLPKIKFVAFESSIGREECSREMITNTTTTNHAAAPVVYLVPPPKDDDESESESTYSATEWSSMAFRRWRPRRLR
jgi:hypothetical protein